MRWLFWIGLLTLGCESSNNFYYYVCLAPELNYKRGYFKGWMRFDGKRTYFMDEHHHQYDVQGTCLFLDFSECEKPRLDTRMNCPL